MSARENFYSFTTTTVREQTMPLSLGNLPYHTFYAGVGLLAGGIGVAVVVILSIIFQAFQTPPETFVPTGLEYILLAVLLSLGMAWGLGRGSQRLFRRSDKVALQITLIAAALFSILQLTLLMKGL
jgi:hypothetical protein